MVDLSGEAVLALWNGVEASRTREYNCWHTREHVAERVAIPGMIGARRYVRSQGPLPEYLTFYALENIEVLRSAAYRSLLDNPTPWSQLMRPSFRGFMRIGCRRLLSLGGGMGGSIATLVLSEHADLRAPALKRTLAELLEQPGIVAAHLLERDPNIADVPFQIGGERPDFPTEGVIIFESYDAGELDVVVPTICSGLARIGLSAAGKTLTTYRLAYAIDRASLERVAPFHQR